MFYIKIFFSSKSDSCKTLVNPSCPVLPHHLVYLCALCIRLVSGTQPGSCSERIGRVTPATVLLLQFTQTEASARPRSFIGYRRYLSHDFRLPLLLFFPCHIGKHVHTLHSLSMTQDPVTASLVFFFPLLQPLPCSFLHSSSSFC